MESKKTLHLLALIFSLLVIETSMASQIPPDDNSRINTHGSNASQDGIYYGNGTDQGGLLVPPPSTKTAIAYSNAVSPTSGTSMTSVNSSSSSSTTVTGGGTVSTYSSSRASNTSTSSTSFSQATYP